VVGAGGVVVVVGATVVVVVVGAVVVVGGWVVVVDSVVVVLDGAVVDEVVAPVAVVSEATSRVRAASTAVAASVVPRTIASTMPSRLAPDSVLFVSIRMLTPSQTFATPVPFTSSAVMFATRYRREAGAVRAVRAESLRCARARPPPYRSGPSDVSAADMVLIAVAGLLAGGVNAVAGGGSLISFPALVAAGLPTLDANVTNTTAVWPGYLGSAAAYREELADQRERFRSLAVTSVLGAAAGSAILLTAPDAVFDAVVPFLVLAGSVLLALQPRIAALVRARTDVDATGHRFQLHAAVFAAAVYGAYFGGGLGVILLAVLGIFVADHLQRLNGLKSAMSLLINTIALVAFALFGPVDWLSVAIVAPASLVGGYVGARAARRLSPDALRSTVVVFGVIVAAWLALR